ncbi:MAG: ArnT family glycosyltransferase [Anaerolineae bacterium]
MTFVATPTAGSWPKRRNTDLLYALLLVAILLLAFALRTPGALVSALDVDDGAFLSLAAEMRQGAVLYRDLAEHKPPGIELFILAVQNLAGGNVVLLRLVYLAVTTTSCLAVAGLARSVAGRWAGLLAALLATLHPISMIVAHNLTQLGLATTLLAWSALLFLQAVERNRPLLWLSSGFLAGAAFACKQPAGLIVPCYGAVLAHSIWQGDKADRAQRLRRSLLGGSLSIAGALLAYGPLLAWWAVHGALDDYLWHVFGVNSLTLTAIRANLGPLFLVLAGDVTWLLALFAFFKPRSLPASAQRALLLLATWGLLVTILLLVYPRFYLHYALQLLPPLVCLGAIGLVRASALPRAFLGSAGGCSARSDASGLGRTVRPFLGLVTCLALGLALWRVGGLWWHRLQGVPWLWADIPTLAEEKAVAQRVQELTGDDDRVLVMANPAIYALAQRRPACQYLYYSWVYLEPHIRNGYIATLTRTLEHRQAQLVVAAPDHMAEWPEELWRILDKHYVEIDRLPNRQLGSISLYWPQGTPLPAPSAAEPDEPALSWVQPPATVAVAGQALVVSVKAANARPQTRPRPAVSAQLQAVQMRALWHNERGAQVGEDCLTVFGDRELPVGLPLQRTLVIAAPHTAGQHTLTLELWSSGRIMASMRTEVRIHSRTLRTWLQMQPHLWVASSS